MFDLGSFPGIQPHKGGSVVGELYEVSDDMITKLDSYESEGELYNREEVRVITSGNIYGEQRPFVHQDYHEAYAYYFYSSFQSLSPGIRNYHIFLRSSVLHIWDNSCFSPSLPRY